MKNLIEVTLAGLTFPCVLRFPETARYFPPSDPAAQRVGGGPVRLSRADWDYYLTTGVEECAHSEYSLLTASFSDALMDHDRMIFHAVAVRRQDRAYLIAARSGVGKSTQARFLQELRPGEFSVICGDRPILEFRKKPADVDRPACSAGNLPAHVDRPACSAGNLPADVVAADPNCHPQSPLGSGMVRLDPNQFPKRPSPEQWDVTVHPSPWNGKENWYGAQAAPLAGLILLQRGEQNELVPVTPRDAAIRTYAQAIQLCDDPDKIRRAAELTTRLLSSVPIWQLTTHQVPDSTRLLLENLF